MSKIQFTELNATSLEVLSTQETTEVVGGILDGLNLKFSDVDQTNVVIFDQDSLALFAGGNGNNAQFSVGNSSSVTQAF